MKKEINKEWKAYADKVCERIGWIGAILVIFGYYLNAHYDASSWMVWIFGNILIGFYCLNKKAYPTAVMSFVLVLINVYGYVKWLDI